jgi:mevalonate pyrophosphate decarboxylase
MFTVNAQSIDAGTNVFVQFRQGDLEREKKKKKKLLSSVQADVVCPQKKV